MYNYDSALSYIAQDLVDRAMDEDYQYVTQKIHWRKESIIGLDGGKFYWNYTGSVRFGFGLLEYESKELAYWGCAGNSSLCSSKLIKINLNDYDKNLARLIDYHGGYMTGEGHELLTLLEPYLVQEFQKRFPQERISASYKKENIIRGDKGYDWVNDGPYVDEIYCCDIYVTFHKIQSEDASKY